ncbi:hypothetical protein VNI00_019354 [Paramarasmius palmivorus]|uniref:Uncharacterized protein n=1 Tax=Paramarasmius palmivorus TaxID=297713 RepID=A0AAW0AMK0_9AGAR
MIEGVEGVTLDQAPDTKIFHAGRSNTDNHFISSRALSCSNSKPVTPLQPPPPQVIILSDRMYNCSDLESSTSQTPSPVLARKIDLRTFIDKYDLSGDIYDKLRSFKVTGPHSLRFLSDDVLAANGFELAEIGDIRDAEEQWSKGFD